MGKGEMEGERTEVVLDTRTHMHTQNSMYRQQCD